MEKRIKLFSLFGFQVRLHPSWIFLALLVAWSLAMGYFPYTLKGHTMSTYWIMGAIGVTGLFFSIVFHEFFHSLVASYFNLPMKGITLFVFGGIAEMADEPPSPKAEGLMAIAGPLASIVLWIVFGSLANAGMVIGWAAPVNAVLSYLSQINLILAAFNMIPAFPLDGGRILRSLLWYFKGDVRWATRWAQQIGSGFGFLMVAIGCIGLFSGQAVASIWWILIGLFINFAARTSRLQLLVREVLKDEPLTRFIEGPTHFVEPFESVDTLVNDYFYKYKQRLFPVLVNGRLRGCVGTQQIRETNPRSRRGTYVRDIAVPCSENLTIRSTGSAYEALQKMNESGLGELIVTDEDGLVGIVRNKDLMEFLKIKLEIEENQKRLA